MRIYLSTTNNDLSVSTFLDNVFKRNPVYLSYNEFFHYKNNDERVVFFYYNSPQFSNTGMAQTIHKYLLPNIGTMITRYNKLQNMSDSLLIKLNNLKYIFTRLRSNDIFNNNSLDEVRNSLLGIMPFLIYFEDMNIDAIVILLPPQFNYHPYAIRNILHEFNKRVGNALPTNITEIKKMDLEDSENSSNKLVLQKVGTVQSQIRSNMN